MSNAFLPDTVEVATRIMYELLGRRWVWPAVTTTETVDIPPGQNFFVLAGRPVIEIDSMTTDIDPDTELEYEMFNGGRIVLPRSTEYFAGPYGTAFPFYQPCTTPKSVTTTYSYGSPPPPEVEMAIDYLATQFTLFLEDNEDCQLPARVKSVSRQGISMEVLNATDFLDNGRTGITVIDETIRNFNPTGTLRRSRVFSMTHPPVRRRNTTQAP